MKVEISTPVTYYGLASLVADWPLPSRLLESDKGTLSIQRGFEQFEAAFDAGFDSLNHAEHNNSPAQLRLRRGDRRAGGPGHRGAELAAGFRVVHSKNPELMQVIGTAAAAMGGVPKGVVPDMSKAPALFGTVWSGGPQTVLDQIRAAEQQVGMAGWSWSTPVWSTP